jgi:hypothetical protein
MHTENKKNSCFLRRTTIHSATSHWTLPSRAPPQASSTSESSKPSPAAKNDSVMDLNYKGGIKSYWKRRGYDRLDAAVAHKRRPPLLTAELGGGGGVPAQQEQQKGNRRRCRQGWRVRRRGLRALSPRRWLVRLRDAYVSAMLRLASSAAVTCGAGAPHCAAATHGTFARPAQLKEYDEKVLVQIYRSILARGGHLAVAAGDGVVGARAPPAAALRLSTVA